MRRKIAIVLSAALLLALLPAASDAESDRLGFIAINETMPQELVNCVSVYGGINYVPYYVFTGYGLGLSYSYFLSAATAYFSTTEKQLFFDLNSGDTYDGNDNHYAASAVMQGGTVYVPVGLMCRYFGMSYSVIAGNEYGSILRITTDAVVLGDTEFLRAARSLMRSYYQSYHTAAAAVSPPPQEPKPSETPPTHEGDRVLLGFAGMPGEELLSQLDRLGFSACFFLTAEDIRQDPDRVRFLAGEGWGLGVWCASDPAADWESTDALLFEAARVRSILAASPGGAGARDGAEATGLAWFSADYSAAAEDSLYYGYASAAIPDAIRDAAGDISLLLDCNIPGQALSSLLNFLSERRYNVSGPCETDTIRRP